MSADPKTPPIKKEENIVFIVPIWLATIPEIKQDNASEIQEIMTFVKISPGIYLI
jgi:hypothetical protein